MRGSGANWELLRVIISEKKVRFRVRAKHHRSPPRVDDAPFVRRRREVRRRETTPDQLVEEAVRLPAGRNPGKGSVLPRQAHPRVLLDEHQKARPPFRRIKGPHRRE